MNTSTFENWDQYFLTMAYLVAMKSKDQSTHVGAIIVGGDNQVIATGYNSLPRGFDDSRTDVQLRPLKYSYFEHSERNAIYNSALTGVSTKDAVMYTLAYPCSDCARAITQAGIREVVVHKGENLQDSDRWCDDMAIAQDILKTCGVKFREVECNIPQLHKQVGGVRKTP